MNERKIKELQKKYGYSLHQALINSGEAWKIGGEVQEKCVKALDSGACYLPYSPFNVNIFLTIPSRYQVQKGSVGSIERSKKYWSDDWNIAQEIGRAMVVKPELL